MNQEKKALLHKIAEVLYQQKFLVKDDAETEVV